MIDLINGIHKLADDGFDSGVVLNNGNHLQFNFIHRNTAIILKIIVCFHDEENIRYNFRIFYSNEVIYDKNIESKEEFAEAKNKIHNIVSGLCEKEEM